MWPLESEQTDTPWRLEEVECDLKPGSGFAICGCEGCELSQGKGF